MKYLVFLAMPMMLACANDSNPAVSRLSDMKDQQLALQNVSQSDADQEDESQEEEVPKKSDDDESKQEKESADSNAKSDEKKPEKSAEQIEAEKIIAAHKKQEAEKKKAEEQAAAKMEAAQDAKDKLKTLHSELSTAQKDWQAELRAAKSSERAAIYQKNPSNKYGAKFLDTAESVAETDSYKSALNSALQMGDAETKDAAGAKLLKVAEEEDEDVAAKTIQSVATSGAGESQTSAIAKIIKQAKKNLNSDEAYESLTALTSPRIAADARSDVYDVLMKIAKNDIRSKRAAAIFEKVGQGGQGELKAEALDHLINHHIDSEAIQSIVKSVSRGMPSAATEDFLRKLYENGTGKAKPEALLALVSYIDNRNLYRDYYADPEMAKNLPEETREYLQREVDPNESEFLETSLSDYVDEHKSLLESAKNQLFVMRNLAVGKKAPNIIANDLDGVEFKLSDYRGKVVFLDFWGDW